MKTRSLQIGILLAFFFLFGLEASAQLPNFDSSSISIRPTQPKANEQVTATFENFSQNINTKTISWSLNGVPKQSGIGMKSFTFTTGNLGSISRVSVSVSGVSKTLVIRPTETEIVWQATDSYVPPFYKGKALFPNQGALILEAIPHFISENGSRLDPKKLIYKWKKSGSVLPDQSGYGKNVLVTQGTLLSKTGVYEVEVTSSDETYKGLASLLIPETSPQLLLYENDPLYGIEYENTLSGKTAILNREEININASPYFFSTAKPDSIGDPLIYTWRMNNNQIGDPFKEIILRRDAQATTGTSQVTLSVRHDINFMQRGETQTVIQFGE